MRAFKDFAGDLEEGSLLCPLRTLQAYLERTKSMVVRASTLFVLLDIRLAPFCRALSFFLIPKDRAKGRFHYPTAGVFSKSLKIKIKIFFLLETVRNDVQKQKMQLFPFHFHPT